MQSKSALQWFVCLLAFLTVAISLSSCKLECLAKSYRYRLTIKVEKNGEIHSGSSVIELNTIWTGFLLGIDNTQKFETHARGEAVFVDLGKGDNLLALLDDEPYWKSTKMLPSFVILGEQTARKQSPYFDLLTTTFPEKLSDAKDKIYTVRPDQLPTLVRFRNLSDPMTIEEVDPTNFTKSYGGDAVLREISLVITQDPVSNRIVNDIPWLTQLNNSPSPLVLKRQLINKRTGHSTSYNYPITYYNFVRK